MWKYRNYLRYEKNWEYGCYANNENIENIENIKTRRYYDEGWKSGNYGNCGTYRKQ